MSLEPLLRRASTDRLSWILHLALALVAARIWHLLLLKNSGAFAPTWPWLLAAAALTATLWALARRSLPGAGGPLLRLWRRLDGADLTLLILFLVLVGLFHAGHDRAVADGREYFAQVRSLVIDRDVDFSNEIATFQTHGMSEIFPLGAAILWMPFFVGAHAWLGLLNLLGGNWALDGFINPYQQAVGLGSLVYGSIGLWLLHRLVRRHASGWLAAAAVACLCFGSFFVWYLTVDSSYNHAVALFTVALFIWLWRRGHSPRSTGEWAALGIVGGIMTMVRWQNLLFFLLPAVEGLGEARRLHRDGDRHGLVPLARGQTILAAAAVLAFLPQMVVWKVHFGGFLTMPNTMTSAQWWSDSLWADVLFSSNHGLFAWHPIFYLALLGLPWFFRREPLLCGVLAAIFVGQIYINGAVAMWWGGHAFGHRRFASCLPLFAFGLAGSFRLLQRRPALAIGAVVLPLLLLNAVLVGQVRDGELLSGNGFTLDRLLVAAYSQVGNPASLPASLWYTLRHGSTPERYDRLGVQTYNNLTLDLGTEGDGKFLGAGWSNRESEGNLTARWGVGPRSVLIVPLKARLVFPSGVPQRQADYLVRFRAHPFVWPGAPPQRVTLRANGVDVDGIELGPDWAVHEVQVPGRLLQRNLNVLELSYSRWSSPREVGAGDDERPLAVRFDRIELLRQGR